MYISLEKTIRAMSIALDLAEISSSLDASIIKSNNGETYLEHTFLHHSKKVAYISLEIGKILNLTSSELEELYVTTLLHDIGAANNVICSHYASETVEAHCVLGASITSHFPIFSNIGDAILYHHENYNGTGPMKLKGDEIPIQSQIIHLADLLELSYDEKLPSFKQRDEITDIIKSLEGSTFSTNLISAFLKVSSKDIFWFNIETIASMDFILDNIAPSLDIYIDLDQFENIAVIFSRIIDSKSKFTASHSIGISELAYKVSSFVGYDEEKCKKMRIAGLLHDIGKLAIPSSILDKNDSLTKDEFAIIKSHVYYTKIILDKIEDITDIADWASNHHEKLNGNGYPRSLTAEEISEEARIIGVCDIYQALTEDRPYRKGLDNGKAFSILDGMVTDNFICGKSVKLLKEALNRQ